MKNFIRKVFFISFVMTALSVRSQIINTSDINPDKDFENIHVQKVTDDSLATSFIIWIKKEVKPHYHRFHTEHIYVVEGTGEMYVGNKVYNLKPGDWLIIPANTVHSVKVTSEAWLKVISIQSPNFDGKDRIWVE
ncbi:MAG: hypothetical protein KatS3mg034_2111 [Vicingaceae bacterium]|nr:MAG: hypothetical protein KatS3mg034_2111 [Vicingaceae bacterium]